MKSIISTPLWGVVLTFTVFIISNEIKSYFKLKHFNPLISSVLIIMIILGLSDAPYETYATGGSIIQFFLGPLTISLAIPIYRHIAVIKKHFYQLIFGILSGIVSSFGTIMFLSRSMRLDDTLMISALPKSITAPMAISLSSTLGGSASITVPLVVITGISGAAMAPIIMKLFRIKNPISQGIGIGTASHAVGTSKAYEMGEIQGAISSVSIGITGLLTVILLPLLLNFFYY